MCDQDVSPTYNIYLSGPMTGIAEFNYPAFNAAAKILRDGGNAVFNPAESFGGGAHRDRSDYMREDFHALLNVKRSGSIAMLPGWEHSSGALLELAVAKELGLRALSYANGQVMPLSIQAEAPSPVNPVPSMFEELLERMRELHRAKRSDYTGTSGDILHNYRTSAKLAGIPMVSGMFARLCEKVIRCSSIISKGGDTQVSDETYDDTMLDLAIISLLIIIANSEG